MGPPTPMDLIGPADYASTVCTPHAAPWVWLHTHTLPFAGACVSAPFLSAWTTPSLHFLSFNPSLPEPPFTHPFQALLWAFMAPAPTSAGPSFHCVALGCQTVGPMHVLILFLAGSSVLAMEQLINKCLLSCSELCLLQAPFPDP